MKKAFTLLELLVVITIIAILALIMLQAAGAAISHARDRATRSALWRLQHLVNKKAEALQRQQARSIVYTEGTREMELINKLPAYNTLPLRTRKLLAKKLILAHHFPQEMTERWDAQLYPPGTDVEYALLNVALGGFAREQDDHTHMVDGWGNPIVFLRWPTRLFAAHPELLPGAYDKDPDDPLCDCGGLWSPGATFDSVMPVAMPDPCKPYVMLFVSAGPDGRLGFSLPLGEVTSEEELGDDIFSTQVR